MESTKPTADPIIAFDNQDSYGYPEVSVLVRSICEVKPLTGPHSCRLGLRGYPLTCV